MAEQFYTILTQVGHAKLANALALGQTVTLTQMAVGQGLNGAYYDPTESQTTLKSEVWRGTINSLSVDPDNANWLVAELVIPTNVGNFTVREAGLFDDEGDLIAVGKYPLTYKPQLADGAGKDLYIRLIVQVSNTSVVTLKVDPAVVLATRGYAEDAAEAAGNEAKAYADARFQGFEQDGEHKVYTGDLDAIACNSLYAVQQGVATHLPEDLPADAWAFVQTMVLPGDIGRTQVVWSEGDPDRPGWWRRRAAGIWSDWRLIGAGSGMPVGSFFYYPGTTAPAGAIAVNDGPELSRATWPELWEFAQNSGLLLTEAEWQAQATAQSSVGYFSDGDGSTTFRLPRLRDYLRGADPSDGRGVGAWQGDAIKGHDITLNGPAGIGVTQAAAMASLDHGSTRGLLATTASGSITGVTSVPSSGIPYAQYVGGSETRPKSINWLPCIQAASVPADPGTVNMLELASEVASLGRTRGLPVGTVLWVPGTTPPPGMLAINDGASVNRGSWPELWEFAQASGLLITEADWQAQAAAQSSVGYFSDGDGSTTFRLPRMRDFVRAADPSNGRPVGLWHDATSIEHTVSGANNIVIRNAQVLKTTTQTAATSAPTTGSRQVIEYQIYPSAINWLPCIQAASVPVNAGTVDMLELASEVAGLREGKVDFSDFTQLLEGNGWQQLPSGLIIQWGKGTASNANVSNTFPVTFPNACLMTMVVDCDRSFTETAVVADRTEWTTSYFKAYTPSSNVSTPIVFVAIGF